MKSYSFAIRRRCVNFLDNSSNKNLSTTSSVFRLITYKYIDPVHIVNNFLKNDDNTQKLITAAGVHRNCSRCYSVGA